MFFSMALTLFLVMDAPGTIPTYLSLLEHFKEKQRRRIALRELLFALLIMCAFFFLGKEILRLLAIEPVTTAIAGSVVLFLIASRQIFHKESSVQTQWHPAMHFIVPIATPVIAGPSLFAMLMIYSTNGSSYGLVFASIAIAWFCSALCYFFARPIYHLLEEKGLAACQRLMGLLVAVIAIQSLLQGIHVFVGH